MAFIGIDNLTHVKDRLQTNIIMGPAYYSADELKRMGIKVITGIEFKTPLPSSTVRVALLAARW